MSSKYSFGSKQDADGFNISSIRTKVSTLNHSATLLGVDATYTGTGESTAGWASITVTVRSDVASATDGFKLQFSHDNSTWWTADNYTILADSFKVFTVQPHLEYFRVVYTNGETEQGTFELHVQFGSVATKPSSHRILDEVSGQDDAEVVKAVLEDRHGHPGEFNFMRDLRVTEPVRLVGNAFHGTTLDTQFWTSDTSGAGAAYAQAEHDATLTSGTANDGYSHLETSNLARFVFAHPMIYRAAIRVADTTVDECTRRWGVYEVSGSTPQNGFYFELSPTGVLSLCSNISTSATKAASGSWNGNLPRYTVNNNIHAYEIHYFLMRVEFYIDEILVHTINSTGLTANPSSEYDLPAAATAVNSATGTTSGTLDVHAAIVLRTGKENTQPISFLQQDQGTQVLKRGPGILHQLTISAVTNNSVVTLYDNTAGSGTVIWTSGAMGSQTQPYNVDLTDVSFYVGLTIVISAQDSDVLTVYE